ncbi:MAG: SRPBCC family protein [Anaerolineae bacterium]|nr:SRPBCC family protein [Anaerolineae bacterium]
MYTLKADRLVKAPAAIVWDVIADVERYAEYAPNLSQVVKTSEGPTPTRRCYDVQGRGWNEACILWEEGKRYSYIIDTSDYPYPFVQMKGTWGIEERPDGVLITMRFDYHPKGIWPLTWLMSRALPARFGPIIEKLFDNWEAEISKRVAAGGSYEAV